VKPGQPLQRKKPMNRGDKPLGRNTGLTPAAGPARVTRINPVSGKRRAQNRERRAMVTTMFPERPLCVVYVLSQDHPGLIPGNVIAQCWRWADDVHEPLTRARGGSITDPANATPPCRPCHDALGKEPPWGYQLGLLRHSWEGPPEGADAA
jgi:hypothetical protein